MQDNRIEWIDIAKGIGIILVIAGHTIYLGYSFPIYAFHMPLFFFLSGLVFKDKKESLSTFVKNISYLLKPWAKILFISFLVCLAIPHWRSGLSFKSIAIDFYTANTNTLQNSSLWYLVCYFFVLLIFFFLNKISRTRVTCIILLSAIASLWIKEALEFTPLPLKRLPFKLDSAIVAVVFFAVAYWNKRAIVDYVSRRKNVFWGVFITATVLLCYKNGWSNINSLDFGKVRLLYYPIAFMGIGAVCVISKWISNYNGTVKQILFFYGRNSLVIFGFQSLFIRLYLLYFNNSQGLTMELYGDNPIVHQLGSFFVVSFILSPAVVCLFTFLRKRNIRVL